MYTHYNTHARLIWKSCSYLLIRLRRVEKWSALW